MKAESKYKVGDELAIRGGGWSTGSEWNIYKITKISPTGRITLGDSRYILEPSLRIRGRSSYSGPYEAEEVTDEIRESVLKYIIKKTIDFDKLSLRQLEAIVAIIKGDPINDT